LCALGRVWESYGGRNADQPLGIPEK
jgi:hypothetical protein